MEAAVTKAIEICVRFGNKRMSCARYVLPFSYFRNSDIIGVRNKIGAGQNKADQGLLVAENVHNYLLINRKVCLEMKLRYLP